MPEQGQCRPGVPVALLCHRAMHGGAKNGLRLIVVKRRSARQHMRQVVAFRCRCVTCPGKVFSHVFGGSATTGGRRDIAGVDQNLPLGVINLQDDAAKA